MVETPEENKLNKKIKNSKKENQCTYFGNFTTMVMCGLNG